MLMPQLLLFPDPRPLVERLGKEFFQQAPPGPGVYLMRDSADLVLYVGKAKNLRRRLGSYRVANPDRMPRRHLRLLRAVSRIQLEECCDEAAAVAREAGLLRALRPPFNRAGTWPGQPRFLAWRLSRAGLELAVVPSPAEGWKSCGPLGAGVFQVRAALVRLFWRALQPDRGLLGMPEGWFGSRQPQVAIMPRGAVENAQFEIASARLTDLCAGRVEPFRDWLAAQEAPNGAFEAAVFNADLETISQFAQRAANGRSRAE